MQSMRRGLCWLAWLLVLSLSSASANELMASAQQKLKSMGYYDGVVDGMYGSQTAAAIRRYQLANKLKVTGELNRQTLGHLGLDGGGSAAGKPVYTQIAELFRGSPLITAGPEIQIETIREAQKNLEILGYYSGPKDGMPSLRLTNALKAYQKEARLKTSGRLDKTTLRALDLYEVLEDDGRY